MKEYSEFRWGTAGPANGDSGRALALELIRSIMEHGDVQTICDLGCGNGYLAGRLAALGYKVVGVDASETGIEIACKTYLDPQFVRELIDGHLAKKAGLQDFDLVVSSDVIEHLYRPADLLEAALPLLKCGGKIVIGTPYHGYLKNLALSITGKMDAHFGVLNDGGHIKFFSVKTLSELLERHGFCDLRFSFYGRAPWLWKNMICCARKG